jgi:hypothetical protein
MRLKACLRLLFCVGCCLVGASVSSSAALAEGPLSAGEISSSPFQASLVTPGEQIFDPDKRVLMLPPVVGGRGGWCITTKPKVCRASRLLPGPIVAESWMGGGPPSTQNGIVLTTRKVAAISIEGDRAIPTRAESTLPDGLRVAVVEIKGGVLEHVPGFSVPVARPPSVTPLNSHDEPIAQRPPLAATLPFQLPTHKWWGSDSPQRGLCQIQATHLHGLVARGGIVVIASRPFPGLAGRSLLACVSAFYVFKGSQMLGSVLVDTSRPGVRPAPLPAARPVPGYPGLFEGPGVEGEMLTRRIDGTWLAVSGGRDIRQRLLLLEHLRAAIHL